MKYNIILITLITLFFYSNQSIAQSNIGAENKFLIVLDVQADYTKDLDPVEGRKFIGAINQIIENTDPDKVIYVSSLHKAIFVSFKSIKIDTIVSLDVDSTILMVNNNKFVKEDGDAFTIKEMIAYLEEKEATDIIVTGLLAEKCVSYTLIGGHELGYNMIVIPEAIIGKTEKKKNKALDKLSRNGITKMTLSEYIDN